MARSTLGWGSMTEAEAIERVDQPVTVDRLVADLRAIGLREGDRVVVHTSLQAIGWVCGGPPAVVDALQRVVTETGTIVMPTHTGQYTDPEGWEAPPVPDGWVRPIREHRPPFRPQVTPSRGVGAVPECFRTYPATTRSRHPTVSCAAWGADAEALVASHPYDFGLGPDSPLDRLRDREGRILLIGVGHDVNTSLHLAEHRADIGQPAVTTVAPVIETGDRRMLEFESLVTDTSDFSAVGADFEGSTAVDHGMIGAATARLLPQSALVEFATEWFERHR